MLFKARKTFVTAEAIKDGQLICTGTSRDLSLDLPISLESARDESRVAKSSSSRPEMGRLYSAAATLNLCL